jgi:hypothetical protein
MYILLKLSSRVVAVVDVLVLAVSVPIVEDNETVLIVLMGVPYSTVRSDCVYGRNDRR